MTRRTFTASAWGVVVGSSLARSRFQQAGTGVYGPSRRPIRAKSGGVLAFKGVGGKMIFRRSVKGQEQRRMVPVKGLPSPTWNGAIKKRAVAFYGALLSKAGGKRAA